MDPDRRRLLRLAALGGASLAGGGYLLAERLRDAGEPSTVAGPPSSTTAPHSSVPSTATAPPTPATTSTAEPGDAAPPTTAAAAGGSASIVLCRDAWDAAPPARESPPHEIRGLMVHHTAVVLDDNRKSPDRIRGHQRYHQSRGFADIAYHTFIDAHGNVYEGRDAAVAGETFTDYDPTGWYLVVCEGNFDEQPLPDAQRDSLARILAWASERYGIPAEEIASHRDHAHTRCPGQAIHTLVTDGSLSALTRAAAPASVEQLCGPEADSRVALIESGAL